MEITTIIEIIEKLIIVVRKKNRDSSTILKTIAIKESEIKVIRTWAIETSEVIVEKQKSIEVKLGKQEDVKKELVQVSEELSLIEAHLLTQTPISADYHVLRSQQSEHSVIMHAHNATSVPMQTPLYSAIPKYQGWTLGQILGLGASLLF